MPLYKGFSHTNILFSHITFILLLYRIKIKFQYRYIPLYILDEIYVRLRETRKSFVLCRFSSHRNLTKKQRGGFDIGEYQGFTLFGSEKNLFGKNADDRKELCKSIKPFDNV